MAVPTPEWLTQRGGSLQGSPDGRTWLVYFNNEPHYRLRPVPVRGQFGCQVTQTINGRRLEGDGLYASPEEALRGGLEDLRKALGW